MGELIHLYKIDIRFTFFLIAIVSIFCPITIYPCFFLIFIILQIIFTKKIYIIDQLNWEIFLFICVFIFVSSSSYFINYSVSDPIQFIKLWINLFFLISGIAYVKEKNQIINFNLLQYVLEIIIILSFIQITINVSIMNLWMLPIEGVENSMVAYGIVQVPVYFGINEKNIWATKIVFIQIIYIVFHFIRVMKSNTCKYSMLMLIMIFNTVYTFSRTAQIAFFISMVVLIYLFIKRKYENNYYLKYIVITIFIGVISGIGIVLYEQLLHITLSSGDGMMARLELWQAFYENIRNTTYIYGNGILSAAGIISNNTRWSNNNFHNVFLNIFNDIGSVGIFSYVMILYLIYFQGKDSGLKTFKVGVLFMPLFITINSQYLGYDNDIVVYSILSYLILLRVRNQEHEE